MHVLDERDGAGRGRPVISEEELRQIIRQEIAKALSDISYGCFSDTEWNYDRMQTTALEELGRQMRDAADRLRRFNDE
jgi:hypothetical protein